MYDCQMSVVIPAYNERRRISSFLASVRAHLTSEFGTAYEVIIVDDGSTDGQREVIERRFCEWPQLRYIRLERNSGKGEAVRTGMLAARGSLVIFADADGATPISDELQLRRAILHGADGAVGSRRLPVIGPHVHRPLSRFALSVVFASLARLILGIHISDTQCGFKMFRRSAGIALFQLSTMRGFSFDVEVLYLASRLRLRIEEVGVHWREVPGSKVSLIRDSSRMLHDLLRMRRHVDRVLAERDVPTPPPSEGFHR
jgi:dolichyl-phosphate beta-glucosyltransferase